MKIQLFLFYVYDKKWNKMRNFYCDGRNVDKHITKYVLNNISSGSHINFDWVNVFLYSASSTLSENTIVTIVYNRHISDESFLY